MSDIRNERAAKVGMPHLTGQPTDYSEDEREFMLAMDQYKRTKHRPYPTWCEVLEVLKSLGYERRVKPE